MVKLPPAGGPRLIPCIRHRDFGRLIASAPRSVALGRRFGMAAAGQRRPWRSLLQRGVLPPVIWPTCSTKRSYQDPRAGCCAAAAVHCAGVWYSPQAVCSGVGDGAVGGLGLVYVAAGDYWHDCVTLRPFRRDSGCCFGYRWLRWSDCVRCLQCVCRRYHAWPRPMMSVLRSTGSSLLRHERRHVAGGRGSAT